MEENYEGQYTVTFVVDTPTLGSRDAAKIENGKLVNGHSFIRLDDGTGNVMYFGFAAENVGMLEMVLGTNVENEIVDDSDSNWDIAKVIPISETEYGAICDYIIRAMYMKDYNIETYNCTTFATEIIELTDGGKGIIKEHNWTLPNNMGTQLKSYSALPKYLPSFIATLLIKNTMGNFYGYTPADAAMDLLSSSENVIINKNEAVELIERRS